MDAPGEDPGSLRAGTTRIIASPMHDHEAERVRAVLSRVVVDEEWLIVGEVSASAVPALRAANVGINDYGPGERTVAPACTGPWPTWLAVDADLFAVIELQRVEGAEVDAVIGTYHGGQRYRVEVRSCEAHDAVWSTPGARVIGRL